MDLKDKLTQLDQDLFGAISSGKIKLIAVTKYASDEQIIEAYNLGLRDFGENYVVPALEKQKRLAEFFKEKVNWHLLGPLQGNKVNKAVGNFKTIQSIHSLEIAKQINTRAESLKLIQEVFIQVNITGDKNGFDFSELEKKFFELAQMKNIRICGLMGMGLNNLSETTETIYKNLRHCKETLECLYPELSLELSMGMSNDYKIAQKNGSTMIRLGRKLFG